MTNNRNNSLKFTPKSVNASYEEPLKEDKLQQLVTATEMNDSEEYSVMSLSTIATDVLRKKDLEEEIRTFHNLSPEQQPTKEQKEEVIDKVVNELFSPLSQHVGYRELTEKEAKDLWEALQKAEQEKAEAFNQDSEDSFITRQLKDLYSSFPANRRVVSPKILFNVVKGTLTEVEKKAVEEEILKFRRLYEATLRSGQLALNERSRDKMLELVKIREAAALNYTTYVSKKTVEQFIRNVAGKTAYFKPLREFPRAIPDEVMEKLTLAQEQGIFESFHILYLDYTKEADSVKSTAQKVKDKDPILFGVLLEDSDKLFYIADWIDEYCDLTLEAFVKQMQDELPGYTLPKTSLPTMKELEPLFVERKRQKEVLNRSNSSNFRELARKEEVKNFSPKNIWQKFFNFLYKK
jgi:hypothetical protein